jgi:hypothetical protein
MTTPPYPDVPIFRRGAHLIAYGVLPVVVFVAYFVCLKFFPAFTKVYVHTEHGAIELATAVTFFIASILGLRFTWVHRHRLPRDYVVLYSLFVVAGMFVALEEVSYGQKFFAWRSPEWFARYNSKSETNLHNMFHNRPSNFLRSIATIGCPMVCIVLPAYVAVRCKGAREGTWAHYLLPRWELATIAVLTLVLTIFNKIPSIKGMATWSGHLGELKEMYWGVAALIYVTVISGRLHDRSGSDRSSDQTNLGQRLAA